MSDFVDIEFDFPSGKATSSVHKESLASWKVLGWREVGESASEQEPENEPDSETSEPD